VSAAVATKPKNKGGRPRREYDWPALLPKLVHEIAVKHFSPTAACGRLHVDPEKFYAHRDSDPTFASAIRTARAWRLAWMEGRFLHHTELSAKERGAVGALIFALTTQNGMGEWNRPKGGTVGVSDSGEYGASDDALPLAHNDMSEIRERALVNTVTKRAITAVLEHLKGKAADEVETFVRSLGGGIAGDPGAPDANAG